MDSGIGPRRAGVVPRILELRSQLADWAIGCRKGRCAEESDEASRTNDMPDNLVNCLELIVSIEVFVLLCRINYNES